MNALHDEAQLAALALLGDPTRRRLYDYVTARPQGAGRDEAASAVGISRMLAAIHLEKLLAGGASQAHTNERVEHRKENAHARLPCRKRREGKPPYRPGLPQVIRA